MSKFIKTRASQEGQLEIAKAILSLKSGEEYTINDKLFEFKDKFETEYGQKVIAQAIRSLSDDSIQVSVKGREFTGKPASVNGQKEIIDAILSIEIGGNPKLQSKTVTPGASDIPVSADSGYDGLSSVTVYGDADLVAGNIKKDVTIFGVTGTLETSSGTDNLPAVMFGTNTTPTISSLDASHKSFKGLHGITSITLSDATEISANALQNMQNLQSISAPEVINVYGSAFAFCSALTSVYLPKCTSIGNGCFANCSTLTSVSLPKCTTVGNQAFNGAFDENAQSPIVLTLPACTSIGEEVFNDAHVTEVILPEVINLSNKTFQNAHNVTTIRLAKVQSMANQQFWDCGELTDLYLGYNGVVNVVKENEWQDYELNFAHSINIHVPSGQVSNYQNSAVWAEIVQKANGEGQDVTFVGDYE